MTEGYFDNDIKPASHEKAEVNFFPILQTGIVGAVIEEPDFELPPETWRSFAFMFCRPEQNPTGLFIIWPSDGPADDSIDHDELFQAARELKLIDPQTDPDWGGMMKKTRQGWQMFQKASNSPIKLDTHKLDDLCEAIDDLAVNGYSALANAS